MPMELPSERFVRIHTHPTFLSRVLTMDEFEFGTSDRPNKHCLPFRNLAMCLANRRNKMQKYLLWIGHKMAIVLLQAAKIVALVYTKAPKSARNISSFRRKTSILFDRHSMESRTLAELYGHSVCL